MCVRACVRVVYCGVRAVVCVVCGPEPCVPVKTLWPILLTSTTCLEHIGPLKVIYFTHLLFTEQPSDCTRVYSADLLMASPVFASDTAL